MDLSNNILGSSFNVNNKVILKNRIVMAPVYIGLDIYDEKYQSFFIRRAMGGLGLIILPIPTMGGLEDLCKPEFDHVSCSLLEECHKSGCKVIPQIFSGVGEQVNSMTEEELDSIPEGLAKAAQKIKEAGYDGFEIHGAHHSLFMHLLSPHLNQRKDKYGGTFENKFRLQIQTVKTIRSAVGDSFPVFFRFSASDLVEGGVDLSMTVPYARMLEEAGVDCLDISAGGTGISPKYSECPDKTQKEGCFSHLFSAIKESVNIPVIGAGRIISHEIAEHIINEKMADMVGIGRPLVADPEWANKMLCSLDKDTAVVDEWYKRLPNQ